MRWRNLGIFGVLGLLCCSGIFTMGLAASWNQEEEWSNGELVTANPSTYLDLAINEQVEYWNDMSNTSWTDGEAHCSVASDGDIITITDNEDSNSFFIITEQNFDFDTDTYPFFEVSITEISGCVFVLKLFNSTADEIRTLDGISDPGIYRVNLQEELKGDIVSRYQLVGEGTENGDYIKLDYIKVHSSNWTTSGYDFNGGAYAVNETEAFQPFDELNAFSVVTWFKPSKVDDTAHLLTQYEDDDNKVFLNLYSVNSYLYADIEENNVRSYASSGTAIEINHYYGVVMRWANHTNDGKISITVYDTNTSTVYEGTAATGLTDPLSIDGNLTLGAKNPTEAKYNGSIFSLCLYEYRFSDTLTNLTLSSGQDFIIGNESHYYAMNENTGSIFYDHEGDLWHQEEQWTGTLEEGTIIWNPVTQWAASIFGFNLTYTNEQVIAAWTNIVAQSTTLLGFPVFFGSVAVIIYDVKKWKTQLSFTRIMTEGMFMIFGLAMIFYVLL